MIRTTARILRIPVLLILLALAVTLSGCSEEVPAIISEADARTIALKDVGTEEFNTGDLDVDYHEEENKYYIRILANETLYEYTLDGETGDIIHRSTRSSSGDADSSNEEMLTIDEARTIALSDAAMKAADVTFSEATLVDRYTNPFYSISFYRGSTEYSYEIDAKTGKILEKEIDEDDDGPDDDGDDDMDDDDR